MRTPKKTWRSQRIRDPICTISRSPFGGRDGPEGTTRAPPPPPPLQQQRTVRRSPEHCRPFTVPFPSASFRSRFGFRSAVAQIRDYLGLDRIFTSRGACMTAAHSAPHHKPTRSDRRSLLGPHGAQRYCTGQCLVQRQLWDHSTLVGRPLCGPAGAHD